MVYWYEENKKQLEYKVFQNGKYLGNEFYPKTENDIETQINVITDMIIGDECLCDCGDDVDCESKHGIRIEILN